MAQQQPVSVATLKAILDAFNAHDLDVIMEFFADDCSLDMPRGPDPWGKRFTVRIQPIDATHSQKRSAGVLKSSVFRGRSLS